jgi:myo-inositol-1(or 4)-monophosphatase
MRPFLGSTEMQIAVAAARAGGAIVSRYFREGVEIRTKESFNLVSDADVESEHAIAETIHREFPKHAILGEEAHQDRADSEHLWIIDPLDGTNNFAHDIPHFAVSIAYYRKGVAQCGVIYNPIRDDWYLTERGQGAWQNGQRAHVGKQKSLTEVIIGTGFFYDRGKMMEATLDAIRELFHHQIHGIRRFGAASLDLCAVGCGSFGAFFEYELGAWDFAAGRLFVEEAGGRVTNCEGNTLPVGKSSVLATNGELHTAVQEIVSKHVQRK